MIETKYVKKKGGRGLARIDDSIPILIRRLEQFIKKEKSDYTDQKQHKQRKNKQNYKNIFFFLNWKKNNWIDISRDIQAKYHRRSLGHGLREP